MAVTDPGPVKPSTPVTSLQVYQAGPPPVVNASTKLHQDLSTHDDSVAALDS